MDSCETKTLHRYSRHISYNTTYSYLPLPGVTLQVHVKLKCVAKTTLTCVFVWCWLSYNWDFTSLQDCTLKLSKFQVHYLQNLHNWGCVLLLAYGSMIVCLVTVNASISYQCHPCSLCAMLMVLMFQWIRQLYLAPTMPTELDGLTDLSSQYIVDYLQHRNCFDIRLHVGGMSCQKT